MNMLRKRTRSCTKSSSWATAGAGSGARAPNGGEAGDSAVPRTVDLLGRKRGQVHAHILVRQHVPQPVEVAAGAQHANPGQNEPQRGHAAAQALRSQSSGLRRRQGGHAPVAAPHRRIALGRAHEVGRVAAEATAGLGLANFDLARHEKREKLTRKVARSILESSVAQYFEPRCICDARYT